MLAGIPDADDVGRAQLPPDADAQHARAISHPLRRNRQLSPPEQLRQPVQRARQAENPQAAGERQTQQPLRQAHSPRLYPDKNYWRTTERQQDQPDQDAADSDVGAARHGIGEVNSSFELVLLDANQR